VPVLPIALTLLAAALLAPERGDPTRPASRAGSLVRRVGLAGVALAALVAIGVPLAATVAMRQSQAAARAGNTTAALADAQSAARLEPSSATAHLQEALVWELQGHLGSAVSAARQATTDEPQNWQPWYLLSRLEREANQPQLAADAYRRARALNPRSTVFRGAATVSRTRSAVTRG
jgi:tetratricopeptide (TPR) repeat protein